MKSEVKECNFIGGLGDLVLCADDILLCEEVHIKSHQDYSSIQNYFNLFEDEFKNVRIMYGSSIPGAEFIKPRNIYSKLLISLQKKLFDIWMDEYSETIVLHPIGSSFANNFAKQNKIVEKRISLNNISKFIDMYKENAMILGSKEDINFLYKNNIDVFKYKTYSLDFRDQIITTLFCKKFIGIDSFFKTVRLASRQKANVIIQDIQDFYRDQVFINPYKITGLINTIYYKKLEDITIETI